MRRSLTPSSAAPEAATAAGHAHLVVDTEADAIDANQPIVRAGALDPAALAKEHGFVELCDTFGLPLVFCATPAPWPWPE